MKVLKAQRVLERVLKGLRVLERVLEALKILKEVLEVLQILGRALKRVLEDVLEALGTGWTGLSRRRTT